MRARALKYLLGAPGVGSSLLTGAPLRCARFNADFRLIPLPETWAPAACANLSGAATVMLAAAKPGLANTTNAGRTFLADIGMPTSLFMAAGEAIAALYQRGDLIELVKAEVTPS